jgi:hypothetical protein
VLCSEQPPAAPQPPAAQPPAAPQPQLAPQPPAAQPPAAPQPQLAPQPPAAPQPQPQPVPQLPAAQPPAAPQPQVCPTLEIDAFTDNALIIGDCVSQCNKEAAKLAVKAEAGAPQAPESSLGWLAKKAAELASSALISLNPTTKKNLDATFKYGGFKTKYDALVKEAIAKQQPQILGQFCTGLLEKSIPQHRAANTYTVSRITKGCLYYVNLYIGCHDLCEKQARIACKIQGQ